MGCVQGLLNIFNVDPTLVRILAVFLAFAGGCGLIAYIIAAVIMPENEKKRKLISDYERFL